MVLKGAKRPGLDLGTRFSDKVLGDFHVQILFLAIALTLPRRHNLSQGLDTSLRFMDF